MSGPGWGETMEDKAAVAGLAVVSCTEGEVRGYASGTKQRLPCVCSTALQKSVLTPRGETREEKLLRYKIRHVYSSLFKATTANGNSRGHGPKMMTSQGSRGPCLLGSLSRYLFWVS